MAWYTGWECFISFFTVFFLLLVLIIYICVKKVESLIIPGKDVTGFMYRFQRLAYQRGWLVFPNPAGRRMRVIKEGLVGANLFFRPMKSGKIVVLSGVTTSDLGWVLIIFLNVIGGLILGIYLHVASRKFVKNEVVPLMIQYSEYLTEGRRDGNR